MVGLLLAPEETGCRAQTSLTCLHSAPKDFKLYRAFQLYLDYRIVHTTNFCAPSPYTRYPYISPDRQSTDSKR